MPHLNEHIDFTVVAYIVHGNTVLLAQHRHYGTWLPIGGHIELTEHPEEALKREIAEECGLTVEVVGNRESFAEEGVESLIPPVYMDIHTVTDTHRHVGLVYFARATTREHHPVTDEHTELRWFTVEELADSQYRLKRHVAYYAQQAITRLSNPPAAP